MLTPQEMSAISFAKAVFGGYDMAAVDAFIETASTDYAALYKENAILKSKIKVLVEKVEEYRSTEDAMRMALLTAQKMGDELLTDAKQKCSDMQDALEKETAKRKAEIETEIANEQARLDAAKKETADYVYAVREMLAKEVMFLDELYKIKREEPVEEPHVQTAQEREEEIIDTAIEINNTVSKMTADEAEPMKAAENISDDDEPTRMFTLKPLPYDDDDEPTSPRPKFDFDNLQFGNNYDAQE